MKKYALFTFVVCVAVTVLVGGCTSSSNQNQSSVTSVSNQNTVSVQNFAFSPASLTIQKGANVTWTNDDSVQHTIVSDTQAFTSPVLNKGEAYTFQFNNTGTFPYHCSLHTYMSGTIVVV
jgi:plastocyanin